MFKKNTDMAILNVEKDNIVLFHPEVSTDAIYEVSETLKSRWIGQGPKVELFEKEFSHVFCSGRPSLAVGSGTDALHLSYILSGLKPGDSVISTVFTCTATNIPFLYMGVKIKFADIDPHTMNISVEHVRELMDESVKAIVCVHYGGLPCDMDELLEIGRKWNIPIIEDAAHAVGAKYKGKSIGSISDFTIFSFQAIKHITTGDGGMLILSNKDLLEKGGRIRWFGIDRSAKQGGMWENDIFEVGYKYQMTDIAASIGLASLRQFSSTLRHRQKLFKTYCANLQNVNGLEVIGDGFDDREHAAWLFTVNVDNRKDLQKLLRENFIESNQVHFRNDRYSIFSDFIENCKFPNMDSLEDNYLVLPLHTKVSIGDV